MATERGIYRLTVKLDGEEVSRDAKVIPSGHQLTAVTATLPFTAGWFGGQHEIDIRVELEPPVVPGEENG